MQRVNELKFFMHKAYHLPAPHLNGLFIDHLHVRVCMCVCVCTRPRAYVLVCQNDGECSTDFR